MDDRIKKIDTPDKCEIFAKNCEANGREDLAIKARQRAVQLRAESHGAKSEAEKEALQAVYAYQEVLSIKRGRKIRAQRTWQMIERHGVIGALERAVNRPDETQGYTTLLAMGLESFAFEAVVVRHADVFSAQAVEIARKRISDWKSA